MLNDAPFNRVTGEHRLLAFEQFDLAVQQLSHLRRVAARHGQINNLMKIAVGQDDYLSQSFLRWYIEEQLEEINKMDQLLSEGAGASAFGTFQPEALEVARRAAPVEVRLRGMQGELDAALAGHDEVVSAMKALLDQMAQWDSFIDVVAMTSAALPVWSASFQ